MRGVAAPYVDLGREYPSHRRPGGRWAHALRVTADKGKGRGGLVARMKEPMPKVVGRLKVAVATYTVIHNPGAAGH
jgi:hypothetical protein